MGTRMEQLLDATDVKRRVIQHGGILVGTLLIVGGVIALFVAAESSAVAGWGSFGAGLALVVLAGAVRQRWEVAHRGHRIRFENGAFTGERLFMDDGLVARGGFGYRMELRGEINAGDGAGDRVMALSEAGLFRFRCRIIVEPAAGEQGHAEPGAAADAPESARSSAGTPVWSALWFVAGAGLGWGLTFGFWLAATLVLVPLGLGAAASLRSPWRWAGLGAAAGAGSFWLYAELR